MAFEEGHEKASQKRRALEMSLEQAQYEADRARRQYDAVEPENRLVSVELEKRWNEALQRVDELEDRIHLEHLPSREIDQAQKQRLVQLGERLDQVWNDPNAPIELKKRIIRSLVNEIVVNLDDDKRQIDLNIHWAGGVHSRIQVRKNKAGHNHCATDKNVVEIVRVYAQAWTDSYIASLLNRLGLKTGAGNSWNETRVKNLRLYHQIPVHSKCRERTWLTMSEAASQLEVSVCVIRTMISNELLPAQQFAKGAPWLIATKSLALPAVRSYTTHRIAGKKAPHEDNSQTLIPYL
jgi:hypothetical protein